MNGNSHVCLVVWRCPCICAKVERAVVFLNSVRNNGSSASLIDLTSVKPLACNMVAIRCLLFTNTFLTSRDTVAAHGM
jgi:hypothetical protein